MKPLGLSRFLHVVVFVTLALLLISGITYSQPLPLPPSPYDNNAQGDSTIPSLPIDINQIFSAAYAELSASRTPADYRVAILTAEGGLETSPLLNHAAIDAFFPSSIWIQDSSMWEKARAENAFDGFIIHASALEWLDAETMQGLYWRGAPVIVLDMTFADRAKLLGDYVSFPVTDSTVDTQLWFGEAQGTHFAIDSYWVVIPSTISTYQQDVELMAQCDLGGQQEKCIQINKREGAIGNGLIASGHGVQQLTAEEDIKSLFESFFRAMVRVEFALTKEQSIYTEINRLMHQYPEIYQADRSN